MKVNLPRIVLDLFFQRYFIAFKTAYPDVTLELFTTDRKVNIIESGLTLASRYSRDVAQRYDCHPFGEKLSLILVASGLSPRQAGAPGHPAASLINFRCINRCFPAAKSTGGSLQPRRRAGRSRSQRRSGRRFRYGDDPVGGERTGDRLCLSVAGLRATERRQPDPLIAQLPLPGGSFLRLLSESQTYSRALRAFITGDGAE